ncbi:hypothetical protein ACFQU7_29900 [Pseudoroseomonas wenyumeiae]
MVNAKPARRLYCLEGLQMRLKPPRRDEPHRGDGPEQGLGDGVDL